MKNNIGNERAAISKDQGQKREGGVSSKKKRGEESDVENLLPIEYHL